MSSHSFHPLFEWLLADDGEDEQEEEIIRTGTNYNFLSSYGAVLRNSSFDVRAPMGHKCNHGHCLSWRLWNISSIQHLFRNLLQLSFNCFTECCSCSHISVRGTNSWKEDFFQMGLLFFVSFGHSQRRRIMHLVEWSP